jgi:hypothetical protein
MACGQRASRSFIKPAEGTMMKDDQNGEEEWSIWRWQSVSGWREVDGVIHICPSAPSPRGPRISRRFTEDIPKWKRCSLNFDQA